MPYFIFEYFIKSTNEIFYVGKGYEDHFFFNDDYPYLFKKITENFDVDYRIVRDNLDKDEAQSIQDDLLIKYISKGDKVANIQTPLGYPGAYTSSFKFQYMVTPPLITQDFELHYFGEYDTWDTIDPTYLVNTSFDPKTGITGAETNLYFKTKVDMPTQQLVTIQKNISNNLQALISNKINQQVRVYKTHSSKSIQSIIFSKTPVKSTLEKARRSGKKIYHLVDVLNFLDVDVNEFY